MKAVIPAAGNASRLLPVSAGCHKALIDLGDHTMLSLILKQLDRSRVEEVVIVTGYMSENLQQHARLHAGKLHLKFVHNAEYLQTNNAYSLFLAAPEVAGEPFLLLDSDLLFEPEALRRVVYSPGENALAAQRRGDLGPAEEVKVYSLDGKTVAQIGKTGDPRKAFGWSVGIERFSSSFSGKLFAALERQIAEGPGRHAFYEAGFQQLIEDGERIDIVDVSDCRVIEVDFPEDLERARNEIFQFLEKIFGSG
jgi:choline kinase